MHATDRDTDVQCASLSYDVTRVCRVCALESSSYRFGTREVILDNFVA